MEYKEWHRWEKEYPWLWAIVCSGRLQTIACRRVDDSILSRPKPAPDSRVWLASGSNMGGLHRPRVFRVEEITWGDNIGISTQCHNLSWRTGYYGLYLVIGTIRPYPEGENIVIYKRPHGVEDLRSLLY